jgi:hypothetical protein
MIRPTHDVPLTNGLSRARAHRPGKVHALTGVGETKHHSDIIIAHPDQPALLYLCVTTIKLWSCIEFLHYI